MGWTRLNGNIVRETLINRFAIKLMKLVFPPRRYKFTFSFVFHTNQCCEMYACFFPFGKWDREKTDLSPWRINIMVYAFPLTAHVYSECSWYIQLVLFRNRFYSFKDLEVGSTTTSSLPQPHSHHPHNSISCWVMLYLCVRGNVFMEIFSPLEKPAISGSVSL